MSEFCPHLVWQIVYELSKSRHGGLWYFCAVLLKEMVYVVFIRVCGCTVSVLSVPFTHDRLFPSFIQTTFYTSQIIPLKHTQRSPSYRHSSTS